ncbi:hypothetical protein CC2G_012116 [Coprinopsis cinerea AmutBmut pab1-1]|nr:hypothetical protein CC2G_012116 [Coprinopsis cinerea AmutBmut pab1-1]
MDKSSTICTSGESECKVVDEHSESPAQGESTQGEDELEGALSCVNDILDEATKEMEGIALEKAIIVLRGAIRDEKDEGTRATAEVGLIKALVTRFARYGWVDDWVESVNLLQMEGLNPFSCTGESPISGSRGARDVSLALKSLREYRQSIDMPKLETAIVVANEALASCDDKSNSRGHLLLRTGNALILKYLASDDEANLDLAAETFQDAKRLARSGNPTLFFALLNLQQIACIRFMECKGEESVWRLELKQLREEMVPKDDKGVDAYILGSQLMEGDRLQLEESISYFRQSLSLRSPGHPRRHEVLSHYAMALWKRFHYTGDLRDLEECITLYREAVLSLRPPAYPDHPDSLDNLASFLFTRFQHKGDFCDLEECITLHRKALTLLPPGHPARPRSLIHLATTLSARFQKKGDFRDLEGCVTVLREALDLRPPGHPGRPSALDSLANSLATRFQWKGDARDLDECVTLHREALALFPRGHPDHPGLLNNLANDLSTRFMHKGNFRDMEESIELHREAVSLYPPGHPNRARSINNLANSLSTRFQHKRDFSDLEKSIELHRVALSEHSPGHPNRPRSIMNLASSLSTRFKHKGDPRDLDECVTLFREVLSLSPAGHPDRPRSLNNLADSLSDRFQHNGNCCDLEESIDLHREALALLPPGQPDRPSSLNNLANSLSTRFERKSDFCDLEECIALLREARDLIPRGHRSRPISLYNLARALSTRFQLKHDFHDLEAGIAALRDALLLCSHPGLAVGSKPDSSYPWADHPFRLTVIEALATALKARSHATSDDSILEEIYELLRSGTQSQAASPLARLDHARYWSSTCREFDRLDMALEAYNYAIEVLPLLASLDLTLEQRQNVLVHAKDLSRDAVQCAIEQGQLETAVVFLSTARSVFWSQALQFRGSLDRLDALHPDLASELRSVTRQLEIATNENPHSQPASAHGLSRRPYLLAQKREEIIARIRATDDFQDFLLPPSFDTLKSAARDGPIVFLNASRYGCDILIMKQDATLHRHRLSTDVNQIVGLTDATQQLSRGQAVGKQLQRKIDDFCQIETRNARLQLRRRNRGTADDDFKQLLEILWDVVAQPVVKILGLQKTDNPQRLWWCPTGPFAFLPIHASGIYSNNPEVSDCLSDYAVSSYCSSPQDLIAPPPTPNPDYEMLVVVEPGDSGPSIHCLPFTMEELKKIQRRIPHERHLVTRIGSAETPSNPDTILGHINSASIVHFGCHGSQDFSNPLDSSLILSGGRLTMGSLIRGCRTSNAALAYLSACETAMGDQERPDESLSLAATMQFAGFRSVVATMWAIQDEDAPIVADVFYDHLFRHGTAASPDITDAAYGLHLAVKRLRDLGRPFHQWVPFVHHGI